MGQGVWILSVTTHSICIIISLAYSLSQVQMYKTTSHCTVHNMETLDKLREVSLMKMKQQNEASERLR